MNITGTPIIAQRFRADKGKEFAYITINSYGQVRVNKAYDYRHSPEDSLYESGNYFRLSEVQHFADILRGLFKNRV